MQFVARTNEEDGSHKVVILETGGGGGEGGWRGKEGSSHLMGFGPLVDLHYSRDMFRRPEADILRPLSLPPGHRLLKGQSELHTRHAPRQKVLYWVSVCVV